MGAHEARAAMVTLVVVLRGHGPKGLQTLGRVDSDGIDELEI
jgi:hypothetical protein